MLPSTVWPRPIPHYSARPGEIASPGGLEPPTPETADDAADYPLHGLGAHHSPTVCWWLLPCDEEIGDEGCFEGT